ncbi:hypothetical protein ACFVR1_11485 [Psychrobacillus sp. NPDC058041]|uniref:hypothetical protein n=1 Tax=Psychrobacillus sp. NPDC058041 TaxID=3346310 RepID=UPI0036DDBC91
MIVYITIIIAFCLLQLVKEIYPKIHSVIYTIYIFLFLTYILMTFIIPYTTNLIAIIPTAILPVIKLLLFSVVLLFVSQIVEELLIEYEYTSLAIILTFTTKAILIMTWLRHMQPFYNKFFSIMGLLS